MHFLSVFPDIANFTNFHTFADPSATNRDNLTTSNLQNSFRFSEG